MAMGGDISKAVMASALVLAGAGAEARAQDGSPNAFHPIKVGIIDTDASAVADDRKGVSVRMRSFLEEGHRIGSHKTESGREHGADVASSFLDQSWRIDPTRRVEIFSAVAFYRSGDNKIDEQDNRPMRLSYEAARKALDWFKENGVRVVVTTFVVPETKGVNDLMKHAADLGMVMFSSTNNVRSTFVPFPARHPDAIAVTGNARNLDFATNSSMHQWVSFKADAGIPGKSLTITPENGSSFAVARAAAFGAHLVDRNPRATRNEVVEQMRTIAEAEPGEVASLAGRGPTIRIRMALGMPDAQDVAPPSLGPSKPRIARQAQGVALAAAGSMSR